MERRQSAARQFHVEYGITWIGLTFSWYVKNVDEGATRGRRGGDEGATRGQQGGNKGATRGQQGGNKGATRGQQGGNKGATRGQRGGLARESICLN